MSTIEDFLENGMDLSDDKGIDRSELNPVSTDIVPFIKDPKQWEQYLDPFIYDLDVLIRDLIRDLSARNEWKYFKNRRYTCGMIFQALYGRKADNTRDTKIIYRMGKILSAYARTKKKTGSIDGVMYRKPVYTLPGNIDNIPPYSLKLRVEWLMDRDIIPDRLNMRLSNELKAGHARNPLTEANMEERREAGKRRWQEYQKKYREQYGRDPKGYNSSESGSAEE